MERKDEKGQALCPWRGERLEKYNQALRFEEDLSGNAVYAGYRAFGR